MEEVLREYPNDVYTNILLGVIYIRQNDLDQAYKYTHKARKLSKSTTTENNIAAIYIRRGDYKKAIKLLEPLVRNEPDFMIALGNLGYAYTQTGKQEEGMAMLLRAAETEAPFDGYFYRCLGIVYLQQNDTAKACEYFSKALENDFTPAYGNEVLELQQKHCK